MIDILHPNAVVMVTVYCHRSNNKCHIKCIELCQHHLCSINTVPGCMTPNCDQKGNHTVSMEKSHDPRTVKLELWQSAPHVPCWHSRAWEEEEICSFGVMEGNLLHQGGSKAILNRQIKSKSRPLQKDLWKGLHIDPPSLGDQGRCGEEAPVSQRWCMQSST